MPVLREAPPAPARSWQTPELRIVQQQRRVEFAFRVPGAEAASTRVYWDEDGDVLTVHATSARMHATSARERMSPSSAREAADNDWYAEQRVGSDVDGSRAEAFLQGDTLRVFVPRVDSKPLTGLPLLAWTSDGSNWSLAAAT